MNYPGHVIKEGESDKTIVKAIQAQLEARGCGPLDKTGVFGPKTKASVKLFQARNVDSEGNPLKQGKIGQATLVAKKREIRLELLPRRNPAPPICMERRSR